MDSDRETLFALAHGPPDSIEAHDHLQAKSSTYRILRAKVPRERDPDEDYEFVYELDPGNGRPYCLASSRENGDSVILRRMSHRAVFELEKPNPYALNLRDALSWEGSIFCVYVRPGVPLESAVWRECTALRDFRLVCKETLRGIQSLNNAGYFFQKLDTSDVYISEFDGRIKIAFDRNIHIGPHQPPSQSGVLLDLLEDIRLSIDAPLEDVLLQQFMDRRMKTLDLDVLKEHPFLNVPFLRFTELSALACRTIALAFHGTVSSEGLLKNMSVEGSEGTFIDSQDDK